MKKTILYLLLCLVSLSFLFFTQSSQNPTDVEWPEYLGGADRNHYSTLIQINKDNVSQLKVAWTYHAPDSGQMQMNALMVKGKVYGVTAAVQAFCLDAATGKELWRFGDPMKTWHSTSRGVAYWAEGNDQRILYTAGPNLWALDANTGQPIISFGNQGKVDLHTGLPAIAQDKFIISNTPGTIYKDLIVMPLRLSEGADAAPGDIRAFNVKTGKLAWTFHNIPYPGEYGYETFPPDAYKNQYTGAANNWCGMAVDRQRGIIYVPTGSAGYDFYGGNRPGKNLFANCLLALDANTGKRLWHFQTTHHDIWDRDFPSPPNLITLTIKDKKVDAVVQATKQGYIFAFDRVTGKPLYPIDEVPVPQQALPGEKPWPTQPRPRIPAPYARQSAQLTENDISPYAQNRAELLAKFKTYKKAWYAPPSREGTIIFPGYDGGAEWGGSAATPNGIIYINSNEMPWIQTMVPTQTNTSGLSTGARLYNTHCKACHGANRQGNPSSNYPSLVNIEKRRSTDYIKQIITGGKGMMPGFSGLKTPEVQAITDFILSMEKKEVGAIATTKIHPKAKLPFTMTGYNKWLDNRGLPALAPPWGTFSAIDMNTGQYLWKVNLGNEILLGEQGLGLGTENYGGPVATASGLLFIAGTKDGLIRAFDQANGNILWQYQLPAAGHATPSTYRVNGKQYIVIACGGGKLGTPKGNAIVAFSL